MTMPKPMRNVSKSRKVIDRFAGSVSSIGPSSRFNTRRSASSGKSRSTGSSSRSLHSSTRIIAAAAVIGLVIEAMRKIVSRSTGSPSPSVFMPSASTCTSPCRLTSATRHGTSLRSTNPAITSCKRPSRVFDNPAEFIRDNHSAFRVVVFVVAPYPIHQIVVRSGLVAALRGQIEDHVARNQILGTARITGIGVKDLAGLVLVEHAEAGQLIHPALGHSVVVIDLALRQFLSGEGHVKVVVEVAAVGRHPIEGPAHAFAIGFDLGERRTRNDDHRHVVVLQVHEIAHVVGPERATDAALPPPGAEHEMIDDQLAAPVEQIGEGFPAVERVEDIFLLHPDPRRSAPSWSRRRVNSFSLTRRAVHAASHSSRETILAGSM